MQTVISQKGGVGGPLGPESAGRLDDAIPLYEGTLADRERLLGGHHPDTLTTRNNLACAYESAGRLDDAIPLFEATLADCERLLGGRPPPRPDLSPRPRCGAVGGGSASGGVRRWFWRRRPPRGAS